MSTTPRRMLANTFSTPAWHKNNLGGRLDILFSHVDVAFYDGDIPVSADVPTGVEFIALVSDVTLQETARGIVFQDRQRVSCGGVVPMYYRLISRLDRSCVYDGFVSEDMDVVDDDGDKVVVGDRFVMNFGKLAPGVGYKKESFVYLSSAPFPFSGDPVRCCVCKQELVPGDLHRRIDLVNHGEFKVMHEGCISPLYDALFNRSGDGDCLEMSDDRVGYLKDHWKSFGFTPVLEEDLKYYNK